MDLNLRLESFQYPGSKPLFRSFEMELARGQSVAFVGSSGSGKSSMIQVLAGLHPSPLGGLVQGSLLLNGRPLRNLSPSEQVGCLGYLSSDPGLFLTGVAESVQDEVGWSLSSMELTASQRQQRVEEALERFHLTHLSKVQPQRLSGGEQQLVCLAAVWARQPLVLLLDEPTSRLDPANRETIRQAVQSLLEERQLAVVWSSSQLEEVSWCNQFFRLPVPDSGSPITESTLEELCRSHSALFCLPRGEHLERELQVALSLTRKERILKDAVAAWSSEELKMVLDFLENSEAETDLGADAPAKSLTLEDASYSETGHSEPRLRSVNLSIKPREWLGVMGPNGSGKTTLAKTMRGLLEVSSGTVHLGDQRVSRSRLAAQARELHYTFQDPEDLFLGRTVREEFLISGEFLGFEESWAEQRMALGAKLFGLENTLETHPRELSASSRTLLAIALGWYSDAPIQILDEPTARLDFTGLTALNRALSTWRREGRTVIVIDHNIDWLMKVCDRFLLLEKGTVRADVGKRELYQENLDFPMLSESARWQLHRSTSTALRVWKAQE